LASGTKRVEVTVQPRLVVNDYDVLHEVVREGLGFGLLPGYQCVEDLASGRLVRVLEPWAVPDLPVAAHYPSSRHPSPKLTAFLELLRERLAERMDPAQFEAVP